MQADAPAPDVAVPRTDGVGHGHIQGQAREAAGCGSAGVPEHMRGSSRTR